jgi:hypothetical protein
MTFPDSSFDYVIAGFIGWDDYFDFVSCQPIAENILMAQMLRVLKKNGRIGLSSWVKQEDLDRMKDFLNSHSIECRRNYCIETKKGWRVLARSLGLRNVRFSTDIFTYTYPSAALWWREMMDYNWVRGVDNKEAVPESVVSDAFAAIQSCATEGGGVTFSRSALLLTATK